MELLYKKIFSHPYAKQMCVSLLWIHIGVSFSTFVLLVLIVYNYFSRKLYNTIQR